MNQNQQTQKPQTLRDLYKSAGMIPPRIAERIKKEEEEGR